MAARVYLSMAYVAPRALLWILLFLVALLDGIRHRAVRSRGFQLFWALVGCAALFVLQEVVLVVLAAQSRGQEVNRATLGAYIFFADLAASYWFGILLLVAAGFCITRTALGPHKPVVVAIPLVYFVTSLVVDYVMYWVRGFDAFTDQAAYYDDIPEDTAAQAGAATGFVFLICLMANTMAMLLAWFFIFDTIQKEKDILERGHTDVAAVAQAGAQPGAPPAAPGALPATADGEGVGGSTHPYANEILLQDAGGNVSHAYVDVVDADLDAPKTFADRVDDREKLRLIRRFFYGVCFYLFSTILVLFLPLFVPTVVDRTILAAQNAVLWLFLAALLWTFRLRESSPYLLFDEETAGMETGLEGPTTELGVMSHDDEEGGLRGRLSGPRFTLDEDEDEAGAGSLGRPQPSINVAAAQQGVEVQPLPTPQTPAPVALPPPPR